MRRNARTNGWRLSRETSATLIACFIFGACVVVAQSGKGTGQSAAQTNERAADDSLTRAAEAVCAERELDPLASVPIDVMQERASLPARSAEVREGASRASRLLPVARQLAAESLTELMRGVGVGEASQRASLARIEAVQRIKLEVSLRDNASIVYEDPHTIRFGTIFIASLPSDEGLVSVMAHELTHAADGARGSLAPLFRRIARRAEATAGLSHVSARRAEELTCDLVGVLAARLYVARNQTPEPLARRAARAVEHNCVEHDETDTEHLSPRQTLRAMLALAPALATDVTGDADAADTQLNHGKTSTHDDTRPRRDNNQKRAPRRATRRRPPVVT
jgi:hypothetical protein